MSCPAVEHDKDARQMKEREAIYDAFKELKRYKSEGKTLDQFCADFNAKPENLAWVWGAFKPN